MEFALALIVLLALVAFVVIRPFVRGDGAEPAGDDRRAALEAAKESKYREIRDTELDYRMGKLAEEDWRAADRELRAQAVEILKQLDALDGRAAG
jgi:membrane protein implicated in regulation of membrane protease activity